MSERSPEGWTSRTLGELGKFSKGKGIAKSDLVSRGIPCLRYAEIYTDYNFYIYNLKSRIPRELADKSKKLLKGDIVFAGSGETVDEIGKSVAYVSEIEAYVGGDAVVLTPYGKLDSLFTSYQLNDDERRKYLRKMGQGSSVVHIYSSELQNLRLSFPPLPEQKKIALILTSVDEVIENTQRQINKLKDLKKAVMNELLTKGIGHTEFKDTELGRIPKSWKRVTLGEVLESVEGGGTPSRRNAAYWGNKIPWATVKDLKTVRLSTTEESITEGGLKNSSSRKIPMGTVIIATRMAVGKVAVFNREVAINQDLKALFPKPYLLSAYLLQWFLSKSQTLEVLGTGSTVKGIRLETLRNLPFLLPPLPEQEKIASILDSFDENISEKQTKLNQIHFLKKSLMQDLLTGKVRVKVN